MRVLLQKNKFIGTVDWKDMLHARFESLAYAHEFDYARSLVPRVEGAAWKAIIDCLEPANRMFNADVPDSDFIYFLETLESLVEESLIPRQGLD